MKKTTTCSICQRPLLEGALHDYKGTWDGSNNAEPFQGRCCDRCNQRFVIPARLLRMQNPELFKLLVGTRYTKTGKENRK